MNALWQALFGTFQKDVGGGICIRPMAIAFANAFGGETASLVEKRQQRDTGGFVPTGVDDPKIRQIKPNRQAAEPADGLFVIG